MKNSGPKLQDGNKKAGNKLNKYCVDCLYLIQTAKQSNYENVKTNLIDNDFGFLGIPFQL
jgi:hypothetical protein